MSSAPPRRSASAPGTRREARWFWVLAALALLTVLCDTGARLAMLDAATRIRTADPIAPGTPLAPGARLRDRLLPAAALDGKWWIIHTEEMMRRGAGQIHDTTLDNAPAGRPVHWSAPLPLGLAFVAAVRSFAGGSAVAQVASAAGWFGPLVWLFLAVIAAVVVSRRFGRLPAGVLLLSMATCFPIFEQFRAGDLDHHGLIAGAGLGGIFCALAGGAGFVRGTGANHLPTAASARRWFLAAGILGAVALWISAASAIPLLVGAALGALAAAWNGRRDAEVLAAPWVWRVWAVAGATASVLFYLYEYFPSHLGWRLEVNHPLYALAWLGGGELLFRSCRRLTGGPFVQGWGESVLLVLALAAVAAPLVALAVGKDSVFLLADPFMRTLLTDTVQELKPLASVLGGHAPFAIGALLWPAAAVLRLVLLVRAGRLEPSWRPLLLFVGGPVLLLQAEAVAQVRWSGLALGGWALVLVVLVAAARTEHSGRRLSRLGLAVLGVIAVIGVGAWPAQCIPAFLDRHLTAAQMPQNLVPSILLRDIAQRLAQSSTDRLPVVLSDPSSSTELSYFGGLRTIGTLYWENVEGLRRAAAIFGAATEDDARARLAAAGVTHLVLPSWDAFSSPAAYGDRLARAGLAPASTAPPFLELVVRGQARPGWLRPFAYPIPAAFGLAGERVRIFEVRPDVSPAESLLHWGIYDAESGDLASAEATLTEARRLEPEHPGIRRWLGEVTAARRSPLPFPNP